MKSLKNIDDWQDIKTHQKLGEILMFSEKLNLIHLGMAIDVQRFEDLRLGEILINMNIITHEDLENALEIQRQIDKMIKKD